MAERDLTALLSEASNLRRDIDDTLTAAYDRFTDDNFDVDVDEVIQHRRELVPVLNMVTRITAKCSHYLSLTELRIAALKSIRNMTRRRDHLKGAQD